MSTFYGSDTSCLTDVGLIDQQVTDPSVLVGQRIARLLQTPRGALGLLGDDPNRGWDLRQYVNKRMSPREIAQAQQQVVNECLKDEQVQSATCTFSLVNGVLTVTLQLVASNGPFLLTLNVSALTVTAVFGF